MKREDTFFAIFILTIILIRGTIFLFNLINVTSLESIVLFKHTYHLHHFLTGIILGIVSLFIKNSRIRVPLFAISLGFVADEFFYIIFGGNTLAQYWQYYSILGVLAASLLVLFSRKYLLSFITSFYIKKLKNIM